MMPKWGRSLPWQEIEIAADEFDIDPTLIAAVIQKESGGNCLRPRFEPTFDYLDAPERHAKRLGITKDTEIVLQKTSWGLMQVMGATARGMGFDGHITELIFPDEGLHWGCRYLKSKLDRYQSVKYALAAYNAGSVKKVADESLFVNSYADSVLLLQKEIHS